LVPPSKADVSTIISLALAEDLGEAGDITTQATIPAHSLVAASIVARAEGVVAGLEIAVHVFDRVGADVAVDLAAQDGTQVAAGTTLARVTGSTRTVLTAERTCLNILGHLSGIATATAEMVRSVEHTGARIVDTRKTTPGLRALEKYAVRAGGGDNHRIGLYDAVLIKDNHLAAAGDIAVAVKQARATVAPGVVVQVEVDTLDQIELVVAAGAEAVLLDNMTTDELRAAVGIVGRRCMTEASGGVTPETVAAIAETGVDRISVGWITHSAPRLDVALDFDPVESA
jgi:nicotinate-nucleotide pyrophosphorylase (carboxylating)